MHLNAYHCFAAKDYLYWIDGNKISLFKRQLSKNLLYFYNHFALFLYEYFFRSEIQFIVVDRIGWHMGLCSELWLVEKKTATTTKTFFAGKNRNKVMEMRNSI